MNKSAIQRFAIWARTELIAQVSQRAYQYGITKDGYGEANAVTVGGRALSTDEQRQRKELVQQIQQKDYTQVMEEVAYTWFNRFIALRFMEVNNYLPSHIRVFSDSTGAFKPEILNDVLHLELPGLNADKVAEYIESNQTDDLYRYLLLTQCNALNEALPRMFERMGGYTELLLPNNILKQDSILGRMVTDIPEEDWTDQVQIIGWLYQFYNTELKAKVFGKSGKIAKNEIPAATQLFTPDWIVRYMVENSLGRLWIEHNAANTRGDDDEVPGDLNEMLLSKWKYYLPEAEQEPEVKAQLAEIRKSYKDITPESLKVIDPCMGSGHILVYAFDVLMQIYEANGYSQRDAAQSILEHNLYGLDIDDRAAQLAYFAVMMKARQYDRRIFSRGIQPHVYAIVESNGLDRSTIDYFTNNDPKLINDFGTLVDELRDAKEYGSILNISQVDFAALFARIDEVRDDISIFREVVLSGYLLLIQVAEVMSQKYDVVVTNPPYMGASGMSGKLNEYVKLNYPDSKSDMSTVCMEKTLQMCKPQGFMAMINIPVWMFLSSYETLRNTLLTRYNLVNMVHPGRGIFGSDFGTTAFVFQRMRISNFAGTYRRLFDVQGEVKSNEEREAAFLNGKGAYIAQQTNFSKIPGSPIAYWVCESIRDAFKRGELLNDIAQPKQGMVTRDNARFMRLWWEPSHSKLAFGIYSHEDSFHSNAKWYPCTTGGAYRKWYGNFEDVVNFEHDGEEIIAFSGSHIKNREYYFLESITWSAISSSMLSMRYAPKGFLPEHAGNCLYCESEKLALLQAVCNSCVGMYILRILSPTLNYNVGDIANIPIVDASAQRKQIALLVYSARDLSKMDWDSFETSWDFQEHPLVALAHKTTYKANGTASYRLEDAYSWWQNECDTRFATLKANEEELNRIFIDIYGLQDELTPEVEDKDVTVRKADLQRDIRSLISYAVGCMFGRYSLDEDGLAYAGGEFSDQWTVVGGQYFKREVVEYYVGQELQRIDSMAEIYRFSDRDLQAGEISAERRNVCTLGSNETSSSINSVEYRRGTSTKLYEGIRELSFDCKRIESGTGNTTYDLCSPKILDAISNGNGDELVTRGWKDANRIDWKAIHYTLTTNHYSPDRDNIIPICDDEYFDDDITGRFVKWVETVYGKETLEENLKFIADALGGKGTPREVIRSYFLNDFYADHLKIYQKRPIYWLFDSGKKNGFKALIYMHRYQSDLLARMRTDYVHEQQERYRTQLMHIADAIDHASASERVKLTKQQKKIQDQALEIQKYEEKIHHLADQNISIDLDDGVKHNYELFADVLAKIK